MITKAALVVTAAMALGPAACSTEKPDQKAPAKPSAQSPPRVTAGGRPQADARAPVRPRPRPGLVVVTGVKPHEERVKCDDFRCVITVVTPKVIGAIEKYPQHKRATIVLQHTNDKYFPTVANLPWVRSIKVLKSSITDLSPVRKLKKLTHLEVSSSADEISAEGLTDHPSITSLMIYGPKLTHVEKLTTLKKLAALNLPAAKLDSYEFLSRLVHLVHLKLRVSRIQNLAPLAPLHKLQTLDLYASNKITDLGPLAKLTALARLSVGPAPITDLSPLAKLTNLKSLSVARTKVKDLGPLANLKGLVSLDISNTRVRDLAPLAKLTRLEVLTLYGLRIQSLAPLYSLKNLNEVRFHKGKIPKRELKGLKKRLPKIDLRAL